MTVNNPARLDAYAQMADQAYSNFAATADVTTTANGTYTEVAQFIDGPLGFRGIAQHVRPYNSGNNLESE